MRLPRPFGVAVALILGVGAIFALVKFGADWLASTDGIDDAAKRAEEVGRARTTVLAILAGGLAAFGAHYTRLSFGLSRQGQITERFTRAIDQLGDGESVDVRLGGIYALERLARESREDHGPIVEVLTAFVRHHAPPIPPAIHEGLDADEPSILEGPSLTADLAAALTVLSRRTVDHDPGLPWGLDLHGTYLPAAQVSRARWAGASLGLATMTSANLREADLRKAQMIGSRLHEATLSGADMRGADLQLSKLYAADMAEAKMQSARLFRCDLRRAVLVRAQLQGAELIQADLRGADLTGADLTGANLDGADLTGAIYSEHATTWPHGFDPQVAGTRRGPPTPPDD